MINNTKNTIISVLAILALFCFAQLAFAEEQWYESLESSSISYPVDMSQTNLDRKAIETDVTMEISKPRQELTSWQNSTQMMIKPSQNG